MRAGGELRRRQLGAAEVVEQHRRHLFHPKRGWFRRLERLASHWLAQRVFSRIGFLPSWYGWQLARGLTLAEASVEVPQLDPALDGLRVLLLTDLHAGPFVSTASLRAALERLNECEPDLILIAGDFVTAAVDEASSARDALTVLRAPLPVLGVLGNHDHYTGDAGAVRAQIVAAGVELLHNQTRRLRWNGAELTVAGIDDMNSGEPDLDAALSEASPLILLSHNPDFFFDAAQRGIPLTLSGHTHGGQIRIPGLPVLVRQSRYRLDDGRYRTGGAQLVVSRGLGVAGLPLRLACPPEGVLITLVAAADPPR